MIIALQGDMTVGFLFASARLGWNVSEYSIYLATSIVLSILGIIVGVKLLMTYGGISQNLYVNIFLKSVINEIFN